jgi:MtN3 and saliva related transmembrane protein
MTLLSTLAIIFGTIGGMANIPQAYKIFKRKSAKDISITTYSMIFLGSLVWILYGIEIKDFPLILANTVGIISISSVIFGWYLYGGRK